MYCDTVAQDCVSGFARCLTLVSMCQRLRAYVCGLNAFITPSQYERWVPVPLLNADELCDQRNAAADDRMAFEILAQGHFKT